jgi:hypothetical protein
MEFEFTIDVPDALTEDAQVTSFTNNWLARQQRGDPPSAQGAQIQMGDYANPTWSAVPAFSADTSLQSFGVKTLPGAGSFFYANPADGNATIQHVDE